MTTQTALSETIQTLNQRVSVRKYNDRPVDDETLLTILNAARRTGTSSNTQTYSLIVVRNPDTKQKLAELTGGQAHVAECPVFVAVCADLNRMRQGADMHQTALNFNLESSIIATVDAALVGQSISLAAESLGYGTVMIGSMRNDPLQVAQLLGLPEGVFVVFGICIGGYDAKPKQKPRLPQEAVIHFEHYTPNSAEVLARHDEDLANHYRNLGRETPDAAWTGTVAVKFKNAPRPFMRSVLEKLGFKFD